MLRFYGKKKAFTAIFQFYLIEIYCFVYRLMCSLTSVCQENAQGSYIKIWRK